MQALSTYGALVEPKCKPDLSPHVDISSSSLSDTFRQSAQEALSKASSQQAAGGNTSVSLAHIHIHSPASLTASTPEVLIAILSRIENGPAQINLSRGHSPTPDALIDALIRLREQGFIPSPDGRGQGVSWRPSQGASRLGDQGAWFHYRSSDGTPTLRTPHEPSAREPTPQSRGSESGRQTPTETPKTGVQMTSPTIDPERSLKEALNDPRNNTARLLQQILANDPNPSHPQFSANIGTWRDPTANPTLNPAVADARGSVTDRLTQLRDALQIAIERSSLQPLASPERLHFVSHAASQIGDFRAVEPVTYAARPQTAIQHEERSNSDSPRPLLGQAKPHTGPSLRPAGQGRDDLPSETVEKANKVLDALTKATQKLLSLKTLRSIEYAAETSVIAAAAAIALGVMGSDVVVTQILALSKDILSRLRGEKETTEQDDAIANDVDDIVKELELACADRGVERINQRAGLVADIPGTVREETTGLALEGIEIDGGPLGITHTNGQGEFIFKNVPVDEGFAIVAKDAHYSFFPCPALGTVSATTYLTILGKIV